MKRPSPQAVRKALDEMEVPERFREVVATRPAVAGRPPFAFTQKTADTFCERLEAGEAISSICSSPGMPSWPTICKWKRERASFFTQYMRARENSAESCEHNGIQATLNATDKESAAVATAQLNAWKWAAAKRNPRTHGERFDAHFSGTVAVTRVPLDTSLLTEEQMQVLDEISLLTPAPLTIEHEE